MKTRERLTLGLIGCGPRGREHVRAALSTGLFELTALADLDAKRRDALAEKFGASSKFGDYRDMLAQHKGLDVVHLCTPPGLRIQAVQDAIAAGAKAVVVEKPMALDYVEAVALEAACRQAGVLLVVNHQKRNMAEWQALRETVASGQLGQLTMLRSSCYGNLLNQGTHMFDMAWNVLGEPAPKWLLGTCDTRSNDIPNHPAPRNALALVGYANGVRATFALGEDSPTLPNSKSPWFCCNVEVRGSEGKAEAILDQGYKRWDREGKLLESIESRWNEEFQGAGQARLSRDVAEALADPSFKHPQRGASALVSFALVEATCRSAQSGKPVEFPLTTDENALARWSRAGAPRRAAAVV